MTIATSSRAVTIELTSEQWAVLMAAASGGVTQLPPALKEKGQAAYDTAAKAIWPE